MTDRKRTITWDFFLARRMWLKGDPISEMAIALGISHRAVKQARIRYKWPPRKQWTPRKPKGMKVTRRCEDCKGHFLTTPGGYVHVECKMRRAA